MARYQTQQEIGALRERVDIQQVTETKDAIGSPIQTWTTIASTWAEVRQASGSETFRRQQIQSKAGWTIIVRYNSMLTPQMRVIWRGRTFQITALENPDLRRRFLKIAAEELSVVNLQSPFWVLTPLLDIDPIGDRAWNGSTIFSPLTSFISDTRALPAAFYTKKDGTLQSFAANALRYGSNGMLVEGAGQNLLLQSQNFENNAVWALGGANIVTAATTAPDGTLTAEKFASIGGAQTVQLNQNVSKAASALAYSCPIYAKAAEGSWLEIALYDNSAAGIRAWFNLATGILGSTAAIGGGFTGVSYSMLALGNGWYRCQLMATSSIVTDITPFFYATSGDAVNTSNFGAGQGIYIWGSQLEQAAAASSYIPTTTQSVMRAADSAGFTIPAGVGHLTYTFDDQSTQQVAVSPGPYTIPTNLNRPLITRIGGTA